MGLDDFFREVRSQWTDLACRLWPDDRVTRLQNKADRLTKQLQRRYAVLVHYQSAAEGLRQRLAQLETRATALNSVPGSNACAQALELDQIQSDLAQDRACLEHHEQAYHVQLEAVGRIKRRLADAQALLALYQRPETPA